MEVPLLVEPYKIHEHTTHYSTPVLAITHVTHLAAFRIRTDIVLNHHVSVCLCHPVPPCSVHHVVQCVQRGPHTLKAAGVQRLDTSRKDMSSPLNLGVSNSFVRRPRMPTCAYLLRYGYSLRAQVIEGICARRLDPDT